MRMCVCVCVRVCAWGCVVSLDVFLSQTEPASGGENNCGVFMILQICAVVDRNVDWTSWMDCRSSLI